MDLPKKQPTAATASGAPAVKAKKPTTLLDAYEVECIRRELERTLLNQNAGMGAAAGSEKTSAKNANPARAPPPPAKKGSGRGVRLLGRHAVAICGATVPVASAGATGRRRQRGGYREVEKV